MNTTVKELKELYESLGGTPSDVAGITTIPDMIAALAEIAGTTIELPAVSSTDNGDVLTVVSGKWAKADPPKELPESATSGQVLTYNGSAWGAANVPAEIAILDLATDIEFTAATATSKTLTAESGAIEAFKAELDGGKVGFVRVTTSAVTLGPNSILLPVNMKTMGNNLLCGGIVTDNTPMTPNVFFVQITIWYSNFAAIQIKAAS